MESALCLEARWLAGRNRAKENGMQLEAYTAPDRSGNTVRVWERGLCVGQRCARHGFFCPESLSSDRRGIEAQVALYFPDRTNTGTKPSLAHSLRQQPGRGKEARSKTIHYRLNLNSPKPVLS